MAGGGKKKVWTSDGSKIGDPVSGWKEVRSNQPWWKSPHRVAERLRKAATRRTVNTSP